MKGSRQPDVEYRISSFQEILLKSSAVTLDGIGFLLMLTVIGGVATEIIGLSGDVLFLVWFWMLGIKFFEGRAGSKVMTFIANAVVEAIPFVNGIYPGFSIAVWRLVRITKDEDEKKAKKNQRAERSRVDLRRRRLDARARAHATQEARALHTQETSEQAA